MALDQGRLSDDRDRFDDVRIQGALCEKRDLAKLDRLGLEYVDERRPDDLPFLLRVGDAGEPVQKHRRSVDEGQRQSQALESLQNLGRLVEPQDAVVDEDAGELIADRLMNDQRRDGRIDAAAQRADHASAADLRPDLRRCLVDK